MTERPVMIMAGGTGGHIFPGLAVARALRDRAVPVVWLGSAQGMENRIVPAQDLPLETLRIGALRGKGLATTLLAPFRILRAVAAALALIRRHRPRSVLSMGGYVAGPGGLASWLLRCPLVVHEQNRVPGLTNRVLARLARRVLAGYPDAFEDKRGARHTGNPVRAEIAALPEPAQSLAGRSGPARLLVLGGSQGARALNEALPRALARLAPEERPQVWHQLGTRHLEAGREYYASAGVEARLSDFIEDMAEAYQWADLVVCRAGALTVAELMCAGRGSVLIPFPSAVDDHQTRNAEFLVAAGAAELLPEKLINARLLANRLGSLLSSREQLLRMGVNARGLARPDAAMQVAEACLEVAR